ncbi:hypothetical protein NTE_01262 [Candidatus Nitrososphaera evergladensis SR1]|jgi:hypothetical protein|uniref:Uncharacterized protein n=1 Tax=Candidatus Nitrososphaera evergladensis SR1 TaxID=1459636 RepID=A0A075MP65_9ARCH|nr:hypothetical protein [Candidatus Nitrososphaera evergladensis]AIF83331.1 hypothetical protein NTE_01262 [Candidatus Nitrososphaera evergladensis SR1]
MVEWDLNPRVLAAKASRQELVRLIIANGLTETLYLFYFLYMSIMGRDVVEATTKGDVIADLRSLGIEPRTRTELNDEKELEGLAEILKQSMIEDYKIAYSERGREYKEEASSTLTP